MENKLSAYDRVCLARAKDRPGIADYIDYLFEDFLELKGDRLGKEDSSILGGIASFHGIPVTVIGHRKGKTTEENLACNFGMPLPEGYRKALRLMKQAEKFARPVITFIDTPGAYPGMEAESHGQSIALAECIAQMSALETPVIAIITGEGSSGGALALGVADQVWMLENAVYSILSPEGFASILWKDAKRAPEASELMKITAPQLLEYGLIDGIIPEGPKLMQQVEKMLMSQLGGLLKTRTSLLVKKRYRKFREIDGAFRPS
ncbi:MAG: acetyl-CoA carboxylase carboxyl transferase subunit alpha [Lachnospiraceae bacterium]|nr:acetyl-CoA carboxylase carboxyl transferase subunit alpha [Lachnospiraceae bacterium]